MTTLRDTIINHVDDELQAMFNAPAMWGSDESVELQVLQLLEFRSIAVRPEFEKLHPRHILDSYQRFLKTRFPGAPPHPLYCLVEDYNRKSEFIKLLREFCAEQTQEMDQASTPLSHDLVLKLSLARGVRAPRASMLSSYYEIFRRVLRAISRRTGTRGRAPSELEEAIDFIMSDVVVNTANGAPAYVVLPLEQVQSSRAEEVQRGLQMLAAVNDWAADQSRSVSSFTREIGEEHPERIAAQVLRLVPGEEVQSVELQGRLVGRQEPVLIRPQHAKRILEVVRSTSRPRRFEGTGVVRAVDIDQRSMKIKIDNKLIKCWLEKDEDELVRAAQQILGRRARVVGKSHKVSNGPDVVVVDRITHEVR